ncbi:Trim68 [Phodopus roborovskii]|uniref:Trim68 protein n=1 Tax=Phodopus roborovskii TaxID=109678 RepID=A0AAU9ZL18_PHORO|nr:Trim68 [Phodopus roborovskii]
MDSAVFIETIVADVNCPNCMTFLKEPVSIGCGHTFCHSCLSGLWKLSEESQDWGYTCPLCRTPVQPRKLYPYWQLASVVDKVSLLGFCVEMGLKTDVCNLHKEPLRMFCKDDALVTCKACNQSPEHKAHIVVPIKDVAWEYKEALELLRKGQEEAWKLEPCQVGLPTRESLLNTSCHLVYTPMVSNTWQPISFSSILILNLPYNRKLSKSWSLQKPEAISLELKTDCHVLGLREILKTFNVHLGPDTVYSCLVMPKVRKSVHYGDTQQNLSDNPEGFYCNNIVLGSQYISLEVEVRDRSEWGLGVYLENVDWKEMVYLSPHYESQTGTDECPLLPLSVLPHQVGVFLDYETMISPSTM